MNRLRISRIGLAPGQGDMKWMPGSKGRFCREPGKSAVIDSEAFGGRDEWFWRPKVAQGRCVAARTHRSCKRLASFFGHLEHLRGARKAGRKGNPSFS